MRNRHSPNRPSEAVVVERLRTEAVTWVNAVALQAGRVARRHQREPPEALDAEIIEADLHFLVVALARLRRCVERVAERVPALAGPLRRRLVEFDNRVPYLQKLRNVGEHIDEYNVDEGRNGAVSRRQVQSWYLDENLSGGPIWEWLGERLDVEAADQAAIALFRGFASDIGAVAPAR